MRFHTLALAVLAATPALAPAQSASFYNFASDDGGFGDANGGWQYATIPGVNGNAWSIGYQGAGVFGEFALQRAATPTTMITVTQAGPVSGSFTHRFNFGYTEALESFINYDGGVIEYRVDGGDWVRLTSNLVGLNGSVGYSETVIVTGTDNPLGGSNGFARTSSGHSDPLYVTTEFKLRADEDAPFQVGEQVEIRFVAGFSGSEEFQPPDDPNWQIGTVFLHDASPVPEPGGVLGAAALGVVGFGFLRRRLWK